MFFFFIFQRWYIAVLLLVCFCLADGCVINVVAGRAQGYNERM